MKTTLDIDDELLVRAKEHAARERTSLTALIEEGLRLRLRAAQARYRGGRAPRLAVFKGRGGLCDTIDPSSNRSLHDAAGDDT